MIANSLATDTVDTRVAAEAERLFHQQRQRLFARIDRMFGVLLAIEWLGGLGAALWISPRAWQGSVSQTHLHVWLAALLGGVVASLPIYLAAYYPGRTFTRHTIGIAQVLFSSLFIHLMGGRLETHFHVFVSLAFLAFYGDWRVLVAPTLVVALDHLLRGFYIPQSVYGVLVASPWRSFEHAGWVLFEDLVLALLCRQSVQDSRRVAQRTAELTERTRELESALQTNRSIVDGALDAVVGIDIQGRIIDWNPQAEQLFGMRREEALGRVLADQIIPPAYREAHGRGLANYGPASPSNILNQRIEVVAQAPARGEFPVELAVIPIRNGDEVCFSAFIRDITERQRTEKAMLAAKEAAVAADQAKSAFLANMSHEIRTPLNGILGFTKLLLQTDAELGATERRDFIGIVHHSAVNLLMLVNDVLDLSKIEAGHFRIERVACSPGQIIAEVASLLGAKAREKGLRLEARCTGGVATIIWTDPTRLRQLLLNLVGNAVKFTERGHIEIIASLVELDGRLRFQIEVNDTGIGIPQDRLEQIFDPFVQGDNSVTRKYGGTGLGLAICRRIAAALNGELRVQSAPGQGTTFVTDIDPGACSIDTRLELLPVEVVRPKVTMAVPEAGSLVGRVLLVEDGDTNRKLVSLVLRRWGIEVEEAENGQIAVQKASRDAFDLILMDMQMPIMDGYTATRSLRQAGLGTPIIALTAHAMHDDEQACRDAGCTGYLTKPVDTDLLLQTVAEILKDRQRNARDEPRPKQHEEPLVSTLPMDDPEFQAIVADFQVCLDEKLALMRGALSTQDFNELKRLAHWLKGAGGTVGFAILSWRGAQLQEIVSRRSVSEIATSLDELDSLARRIHVEPVMSSSALGPNSA